MIRKILGEGKFLFSSEHLVPLINIHPHIFLLLTSGYSLGWHFQKLVQDVIWEHHLFSEERFRILEKKKTGNRRERAARKWLGVTIVLRQLTESSVWMYCLGTEFRNSGPLLPQPDSVSLHHQSMRKIDCVRVLTTWTFTSKWNGYTMNMCGIFLPSMDLCQSTQRESYECTIEGREEGPTGLGDGGQNQYLQFSKPALIQVIVQWVGWLPCMYLTQIWFPASIWSPQTFQE